MASPTGERVPQVMKPERRQAGTLDRSFKRLAEVAGREGEHDRAGAGHLHVGRDLLDD